MYYATIYTETISEKVTKSNKQVLRVVKLLNPPSYLDTAVVDVRAYNGIYQIPAVNGLTLDPEDYIWMMEQIEKKNFPCYKGDIHNNFRIKKVNGGVMVILADLLQERKFKLFDRDIEGLLKASPNVYAHLPENCIEDLMQKYAITDETLRESQKRKIDMDECSETINIEKENSNVKKQKC